MNKVIKEKIGFIGCGNMGSAILHGILEKKIARARQIVAFDPMSGTLRDFKKLGIKTCKSNQELIACASIIVLAIKPQELKNLAGETKGLFQNKTIISILAGTPISKIKKFLGSGNEFVRAMPNLGAKVGESMTALCGSSAGIKKAQVVFSGCGKVLVTKESLIDVVTAVSGSGPAYFFYLIEILAGFAKRNGFSEKEANLLAVQTALGASKLADQSGERPAELRVRVTSKGGTTAAALSVLQSKKVDQIFQRAFQSAWKRAKALSV